MSCFVFLVEREMSPPCDCCAEHISKLNQQVSVMRKEIKNLRYVKHTTDWVLMTHIKVCTRVDVEQMLQLSPVNGFI